MSYNQAQPQPQAPYTGGHVKAKKPGMPTWAKVMVALVGGSVLICGGGFVACTALVGKGVNDASKEYDAEQAAKVNDVKINKCDIKRVNAQVLPSVDYDLDITNTTKDQQTYLIDLFAFDAAGTRVGNTTAIVSDVRPGQSVKETSTLILTKQVDGVVTCKVDKVR